MATAAVDDKLIRPMRGVDLELTRRGKGPPLLYLHGAGGSRPDSAFIDMLAERAEVFAPTHPGFSGSELPDWIDHIDDLVYLYMDLLDGLKLENVTLAGFSMGGWIAAEMAVRSTTRLARLVLVGAVGIKAGDRETRDIPDIWGLHPRDVAELVWHRREMIPDYGKMTDAELERIARDQEAAALYLWEPYMHNPRLLRRLHRVDRPTLLLRGAHDGLVSRAYMEAWAAAIPGARHDVIEGAGHVPDVEQPAALAQKILRFAGLG